MLRVKKIIFVLASILFTSIGLAQHSEFKDIDSLKRKLPLLHDSAKIDCLLKISFEYGHTANDTNNLFSSVNADSSKAYASTALQQSKAINYQRGIANAYENLGEMNTQDNYKIGEECFKQAVIFYTNINDAWNLSWSCLWLGWCLEWQCKFNEARIVYERALSNYLKLNNQERIAHTYRMIGETYNMEGYNTISVQFAIKDIRIIKQLNIQKYSEVAYLRMGNLYLSAGDTGTAIYYYQQTAQKFKTFDTAEYYAFMSTINLLKRNYDSALFYLKLPGASVTHYAIGDLYFQKKDYSKALPHFFSFLDIAKQATDVYDIIVMLDYIAKDYLYQNNLPLSLQYSGLLYKSATQNHTREFIKDADWLLWKIYDTRKEIDSAYKYRLQFDIINDSIAQDQLARDLAVTQMKFDDEQKQSQINLLRKNNQIDQQQLKNESLQRDILVAIISATIILSFIILRALMLKRKNEKLESEKKQSELQSKASELEMQALRSQMNPHFIFNCLSSINRFILKNEAEAASNYLTKFSRLIRMVLINSKRQFISLDDELETLSLYLDLEKLRFKDSFDYKIAFINSIDPGNIFVPPLLLQPFAENAIWHGLMHKEAQGHLEIEISTAEKILCCVINDNGIGRAKAAALKSKSAEKHKSMGLQMTAKRIALLNMENDKQAFFNIEDIFDKQGNAAGTRVIFKINYQDATEVIS